MADVALLDERPDLHRVLRRAWPFLRAHRLRIGLALLVSFASTASLALIPAAIGRATDALIAADAGGVLRAAGLVFCLAVIRSELLRVAEIRIVTAGEGVVRDLRDTAVERLAGAPLRFVEAHRSGDLLRRATGEISDLAVFIRTQLPNALNTFGYLGFTSVLLLLYSWQLMLLLVVVFVPIAVIITRAFQRVAAPAFSAEAATQATVAATYRETVGARELLQLNGGAASWVERFDRDNQEYQRATRQTQVAMRRVMFMQLAQGVSIAVLLVAGGWLVSTGSISVGTVVVFVLASRELFTLVGGLAQLIGQLQTSRVGMARLLDLLAKTGPSSTAGTGPVAAPGTSKQRKPAKAGRRIPARGDLAAEDVFYSYDGERDVLHGLSVEFPAGARIGLVGETGSGKTTFAKLLTGLYAPDLGRVRYAGVPLRKIPADVLRKRLLLIPQEGHLLSGSLQDNLDITPGRPSRRTQEQAVADLGLTGWLDGLPDGMATDLGPRGGNLSAGERQLVGLIRAALIDPAVLVLDEATADLDPDTAARLESAIDRLRADRTLIVIAHRTATIERLPSAVRLHAGRLVSP